VTTAMNDSRLLRALLGHLRVLEETYELPAADAVRLVAALATERMQLARNEGLDDASLDQAWREGAALFPSTSAPDPFAQAQAATAAAEQVPEPVRTSAGRFEMELEQGPELDLALTDEPAAAQPAGAAFGDELELDLGQDAAAATTTAAPEPEPEPEPVDPFDLSQLPAREEPASAVAAPPATPADADPFELFDQVAPLEEPGPQDAVAAGIELVPVPAESDVPDLQGGIRRHPRLEARLGALVKVDGVDAPLQMLTRDLSSGGMYLCTEEPIMIGTAVLIRLVAEDGNLDLPGQVVHSVDLSTAATSTEEPGIGVRFDELSAAQAGQLGRLLDAVARELEAQAQPAVEEQRDETLAAARQLLAHIKASRLYEALGVSPACSDAELNARIEQLGSAFTSERDGASGERAAVLEAACGVIAGVSKTIGSRSRRIAYDFAHGHVRAEERLAELEQTGVSVNSLRAIWHKVFPEQLTEAQGLISRAVAKARHHDYEQAAELAARAIELDPFNQQIRDRMGPWEIFARVTTDLRANQLRADEILAWAAQRGVDAEKLRAVFRVVEPAGLQRAKEITQHAMREKEAGRHDRAIALARDALGHDPFNQALRRAVDAWQADLVG